MLDRGLDFLGHCWRPGKHMQVLRRLSRHNESFEVFGQGAVAGDRLGKRCDAGDSDMQVGRNSHGGK